MKNNGISSSPQPAGEELPPSTATTSAAAPEYYVAIGASAGGLEAIEAFFANLPLDTGMGFIVVQHLSPDYKSLMVEILSKKTAMPVQRIEDGMRVLPDHIYLIPPKKNLTIFHGKLLLQEQDHVRGINLPIDVFMRSLAEDQGEKAVGIVLSGTGSDGMRGVRAIKEAGGMVMVQDENSAKFDGMPRAAISTGMADFILPPEDMPRQLLAYSRRPYSSKADRSDTLLSEEDQLTRIYAILRERSKLDFTYYKPSTVIRRIERRMTINQIDEIKDYVSLLNSHPGEAMALYHELLIGVTRFFRDQEAFEALSEDVLPALLSESPSPELRFWVAGCSTGEEAYSLAILVRECQEKLGVPTEVKIFATDVDRDAIQYAASGVYPESIAADIAPKLLAKYFLRKDDNYVISRKVREMVVFAQHNLIKDPPFTNITLLSCRNLLIYLQPVLQRKILEFFNFSLNPNGILFLGTSETTGEMADYFEAVSQKWRIYRSKGRLKQPTEQSHLLSITDTRARDLRERMAGIRRSLRTAGEEQIFERFLETVAGEYLPLAVIVNEQMEVLHIFGDSEGYLKLPSGKLVNDLARMAPRELSIPLTTGVQKALRQRKEVQFRNIRLKSTGGVRLLEVHVLPMHEKKGQEPLAIVFISQMQKSPPASRQDIPSYDLSKETEEHLRDLEQELQFTRENLQATIEELETSNEELQATNEELLASNEELQSTNEELQSTNEELFTVNAEYQSKIIELTELHNDIENLLSASQIAQVLLDENLEIRRYSSAASKIFKILSADIGRPITHISHNLTNVDSLEKLILSVQRSNQPIEREAQTKDGRCYILKIAPYAVGPKAFSGTVLTLIDITGYKEAQADLEAMNRRFQSLFETMVQGVVYQSAEGAIISANPAAERILGLSLDQMIGRKSIDKRWRAIRSDGSPFPGEEHPAMVALKTGQKVIGEEMGVFNPQSEQYTWIKVNAIPLFQPGSDKPYQVYTTFEDITEQKITRQALEESQARYRQMFDEMPEGFALHEILVDEHGQPSDYRFLSVNRAFERLTGLKAEEVVGKRVREVIPDIEETWIERYGRVALSGETLEFEDYNRALQKHFEVHAFCPAPRQFAVMFQDITYRKRLEEQVRQHNLEG